MNGSMPHRAPSVWALLVEAVRAFGWRQAALAVAAGSITLYGMGAVFSFGPNVNLPRAWVYNVLQFGLPLVLGLTMACKAVEDGRAASVWFGGVVLVTGFSGVWVVGKALSPLLGGEAFWAPESDVYLVFSVFPTLALLALAVFHWHSAHLARQRWGEVQLQAANDQRTTHARRLLSLQARVEPAFLFSTLGRVRQKIQVGSERATAHPNFEAEALLSDLIALLRAMQPHTDAAVSTLGREVEIAQRFARVDDALDWQGLSWQVPPETLAAEIAPSFLLPLLREWLGTLPAGASAQVAAAWQEHSGLRLELTCAAPHERASASALAQWLAPLEAVHGGAASIEQNERGLVVAVRDARLAPAKASAPYSTELQTTEPPT